MEAEINYQIYPPALGLLFDVAEKVFNLSSVLYPQPLYWDSKCKKVVVVQKVKIVIWELITVALMFQGICIPSACLILKSTSKGPLSLLDSLLLLGILVYCIQIISICGVVRFKRYDIKVGINNLMQILDSILALTGCGDATNFVPPSDAYRKFCSLVLKNLRWIPIGIPFFTAAAIYEQQDPLYHFIEAFILPENSSFRMQLSAIVVRYLVTCICVTEAVRLLVVALIAVVLLLYCVNLCVKMLSKRSKVINANMKDMSKYITLQLIINCCVDVIKILAMLYMGLGQVIMVFLFYGTLKFAGKLPFFIYIAFPVASLGLIFALITLLPEASKLHGLSSELLRQWNFKLNQKLPFPSKSNLHALMLKKKLHAMIPIRLYCGPFFYLKRESKAEYLCATVNNTCTAILSF